MLYSLEMPCFLSLFYLLRYGINLNVAAASTPNLDRSAELCQNLPALWELPGVTRDQRMDLAREIVEEIRELYGTLVAVKPRPECMPLFAYSLLKENQNVGGKCSS